jgi:hypothetical protein
VISGARSCSTQLLPLLTVVLPCIAQGFAIEATTETNNSPPGFIESLLKRPSVLTARCVQSRPSHSHVSPETPS